jgi:uncharacterized protein (DUF983 family)
MALEGVCLMALYGEYLSLVLNPKAWERTESEPSLVGPEDFVSVIVIIFSMIVFVLVVLFGNLEGNLAIANHLQLLGPLFILVFFTAAKARAIKQGLSARQINGGRILQCFGIWLNGAVLCLYLMNASQ